MLIDRRDFVGLLESQPETPYALLVGSNLSVGSLLIL
jgi:hypothetical protein